MEKSRAAEALQMMSNIAQANERYYLANGEYTSDYANLDIEIHGETVEFAGLLRRRTKDFNYAPAGISLGVLAEKYIAVANRLPAGTKYFLYKTSKDPNIYCVDCACGKDAALCSMLSGGKKGANGDFVL